MIDKLYNLILERKANRPEGSYVTSLFDSGEDRIIQKVGEEAVEVVIAAKNNNKQPLVEEMADLLFHSLVLLAQFDIKPEEILQELEKREKKH